MVRVINPAKWASSVRNVDVKAPLRAVKSAATHYVDSPRTKYDFGKGLTRDEKLFYMAARICGVRLGGFLANTASSYLLQLIVSRFTTNPIAINAAGTAGQIISKAAFAKALECLGPNIKLPKSEQGCLYSWPEFKKAFGSQVGDASAFMSMAVVTVSLKGLTESFDLVNHFRKLPLGEHFHRHPDALGGFQGIANALDFGQYVCNDAFLAFEPTAKLEYKGFRKGLENAKKQVAALWPSYLWSKRERTPEEVKFHSEVSARTVTGVGSTAWNAAIYYAFKGIGYAQASPLGATAGTALRLFLQTPMKDALEKKGMADLTPPAESGVREPSDDLEAGGIREDESRPPEEMLPPLPPGLSDITLDMLPAPAAAPPVSAESPDDEDEEQFHEVEEEPGSTVQNLTPPVPPVIHHYPVTLPADVGSSDDEDEGDEFADALETQGPPDAEIADLARHMNSLLRRLENDGDFSDDDSRSSLENGK